MKFERERRAESEGVAEGKRCFIIIIILYFVITFVQGIYDYILETNHVRRIRTVAAFLYLQFVVHVKVVSKC